MGREMRKRKGGIKGFLEGRKKGHGKRQTPVYGGNLE